MMSKIDRKSDFYRWWKNEVKIVKNRPQNDPLKIAPKVVKNWCAMGGSKMSKIDNFGSGGPGGANL
jgi:hypothetical protein